MMVAELDEVHYDLEVDGEQVRRQLARKTWEARGWATVAVTFQERAPDGTWKPTRLALLRFRKVRDAWKKHAAITLGATDALALTDTLDSWRDMIEASGTGGRDDDDAAEE